MADRYLLESSLVDGYLLEDGSGVLLLEGGAIVEIDAASTVTSTRTAAITKTTEIAANTTTVTSTRTAAVDATKTVAAATTVTSTLTASLDVVKTVSAATTVTSTLAAVINYGTIEIAAASTITSTLTASLDVVKTIAASTTVTSTRTAALDTVKTLAASTTVTNTSTAAVGAVKEIAAAFTVTDVLAATISYPPITISAASVITSTLVASIATPTTYVAATSSSYPLTIKSGITVTKRFYADWVQTYIPGGNQAGFDRIQQSDIAGFTGGYTNYKALVGFNPTALDNFFVDYISTISVTFSLRFTARLPFSDLKVILGAHNRDTKPGTYPTGTFEDLNRSMTLDHKVSLPTRVSHDITTLGGNNTGDKFSASLWRGVTIGPAPSTALAYYFEANDGGAAPDLAPWIEFTITKWGTGG